MPPTEILGPAQAVPGEVVVSLRPAYRFPLPPDLIAGSKTEAVLNLDPPVALVHLPPAITLESALATLRANRAVASATPNFLFKPSEVPASDDPLTLDQWAFRSNAADVFGAWPLLEASSSARVAATTVAVLDTGVDPYHPDLRVLPGFNAYGPIVGDAVSTASFSLSAEDHGTAVAGVIGSFKDNAAGSAGVAPGVSILPIRVTGDLGGITLFSILRGLEIAGYYNRADSPYGNLANGSAGKVRVVNLSAGLPLAGRLEVFDRAIEFLWDRGIVVCAAAGNSGAGGSVQPPANSPRSIAVSATTLRLLWEELAAFSNRGAEVWVSAPGTGIWSTTVGADGDYSGAYRRFSGTSAATAIVSGAAAAINAMHGDDGPAQETPAWSWRVKNHLARTADDLGAPGFDPFFGNGRINVKRAVAEVPAE